MERDRFDWLFAPRTLLQTWVSMLIGYTAIATGLGIVGLCLFFRPVETVLVGILLFAAVLNWLDRTNRRSEEIERKARDSIFSRDPEFIALREAYRDPDEV